ncbi:MAG: type III pantothenate kinase [Rikenellaceae bacterium]|jgi:type III pantothenate kinase|nr:type III pantothenate kinase [Rikenellaceae bacterium]
MNLAIDIGNTFIKMALFAEGQIVERWQMKEFSPEAVSKIFTDNPLIDKAIVVDGRGEQQALEEFIKKRVASFVRCDGSVPVPIKNLYSTPATLGYDRLAAAVGAHAIYPQNPVLIVDFGTAITYDVVTAEGEFLGGNISPGAESRFRALHDHTATLPLLSLPSGVSLTGHDTTSAIENGVALGILFETERYMEALRSEYSEIQTIFTGGDANYFAKLLKNPIFATSELVFYGLNAILEYNAK